MRETKCEGDQMGKILLIIFTGLTVLLLAGCETTSGGSKNKQPTGLQRSYGGGP